MNLKSRYNSFQLGGSLALPLCYVPLPLAWEGDAPADAVNLKSRYNSFQLGGSPRPPVMLRAITHPSNRREDGPHLLEQQFSPASEFRRKLV